MVGGVNCSQVCLDLLESEEKLKLNRTTPTGPTVDPVVPVWIYRSHCGATAPNIFLLNLRQIHQFYGSTDPTVDPKGLVWIHRSQYGPLIPLWSHWSQYYSIDPGIDPSVLVWFY